METAATVSLRPWNMMWSGPRSHRRERSSCCCLVPSQACVFTAARLSSSTVRIMGPGSEFVGGFGKLLGVDEFFVQPTHHEVELFGPHKLETMIYFLEETMEDCAVEGSGRDLRHGIQVFLEAQQHDGFIRNGKDNCVEPLVSYVKEAVHTQMLLLDANKREGGAKIHVVAGQLAELFTPTPPHDFVFLDISMRPGSQASIPLDASYGLLIYILEGVGIFNRYGASLGARPFYENEGHGIWLPPKSDGQAACHFLHVSAHLWSSLRFILVGGLPFE